MLLCVVCALTQVRPCEQGEASAAGISTNPELHYQQHPPPAAAPTAAATAVVEVVSKHFVRPRTGSS